MSEIKLKKCPFCGGEAEIFSTDEAEYPLYSVRCAFCMCRIDDYANTSFAVEMWNRRASEWHKWPDEKPPEEDVEYLVTYEGTDVVYTDCYSKGIWGIELVSDELKALAWRELPEPWEGDHNNDTYD